MREHQARDLQVFPDFFNSDYIMTVTSTVICSNIWAFCLIDYFESGQTGKESRPVTSGVTTKSVPGKKCDVRYFKVES